MLQQLLMPLAISLLPAPLWNFMKLLMACGLYEFQCSTSEPVSCIVVAGLIFYVNFGIIPITP